MNQVEQAVNTLRLDAKSQRTITSLAQQTGESPQTVLRVVVAIVLRSLDAKPGASKRR